MNVKTTATLATLLALAAPSTAVSQEKKSNTEETENVIDSFEPRRDYHLSAVLAVDTPILHIEDGFVAPLVKIELYTELGDSPLDLLATITSNESNIALTARSPIGDFSFRPFVRYLVHGDHLHYEGDGIRHKDRETSASEFGASIEFATDKDKPVSLTITHDFGGKTYGFPTEPSSGIVPDNHFQHRTKVQGKVQRLEEDRIFNRKHGFLLDLNGTYEARPNFTSNIPGFEDNEHTVKLAGMLGVYVERGFFNVHIEARGSGQIGADLYNAEQQGSVLSAYGPAPGTFFKEFEHSQTAQANLRLGFMLGENVHLQPGFGVLYLPGDNTVEGASEAVQDVFPSVGVKFNTKIPIPRKGKEPLGFPFFGGVEYAFAKERNPDTFGGAHSGGLEIYFGFAAAIGKTKK